MDVCEGTREDGARGTLLIDVQGKMCHSQCHHDPEGPRTKTNPPSRERGSSKPTRGKIGSPDILVDSSSKLVGKIGLDKNVLLQEALKHASHSPDFRMPNPDKI